MKIAIYQPRVSYYMGGGEVVPLEQAKLLSILGHDITLLTTKAIFIDPIDSFNAFSNIYNINIEYISVPQSMKWIYDQKPGVDWRRWDLESLHVGRLAYEYFLKYKYDLVVSHNLFDAIAIPSKQVSVMHLHGSPDKFEPHHLYLSTLPDKFIAVSESVAEKWMNLPTINKKPKVIKNGIDLNRFKPVRLKNKYDFLYMGRLIPNKGVDLIIQALSYMKKQHNVLPILAVGGIGPYKEVLEKMAKELGVSDQVDFLGYIEDKKIPKIYSEAHICIFPSKGKEGVLTTILEAAACKKPIIASSVGGIPEFLNNGVNGILVTPNDYKNLAEAMYELLISKYLQKKLSNNAYDEVCSNWSWENKIKELDDFYNKVIAEGKRK